MGYKSIEKIVKGNNRFVIINEENNEIVDDGNGFGYKTLSSCDKALWYKFKKGKEKIEERKLEIKTFYNEHPEIRKYILDVYKKEELFYSESVILYLIELVEKKFGIILPIDYLKHI